MKPSKSVLSFVGTFFISDSISLLVIDLFIVCVFLGIHPFNLGYLICWHINVIVFSYNPSYFCKVHSDVSFILDFS